jgi:hypothetical protein
MTVWITKLCLTRGIRMFDDAVAGGYPSMVCVPSLGSWGYFHGEGREWHRTLEGAKSRAEEMRQKKIKSHRAAIAKLEKLKF